MARLTLKSSTIFISVGNRTEVYRSVQDVPAPLRKKLEETTNGMNSATILIADRRGRDEIMRAIRGGSNLKTRLTESLRNEPLPTPVPVKKQPFLSVARDWAQVLLPGLLGALTWLVFSLNK